MYKIPENYREELVSYREQVGKALNNAVDPVQFKVYRVTHGIYEQRKRGTYMVRIRCAGGFLFPFQMKKVCHIAKQYGSPFLHITTRQEIQLHNIKLQDTPDILDELHKIGLSTKGGGGNTVRNITASIESGIDKDPVFDVLPYCFSLTGYLIEKPFSFTMPRKFKIAFSCSEKDTALAAFCDLGFIAKQQGAQRGFKVFLGGSPSVRPMVGHVLFDFIKEEEIFGVALAAIELFHRLGNRKNRHQARLRYVFYKYGKEKVFEDFQEIYNQYKNTKPNLPLPLLPENNNKISLNEEQPADHNFDSWRKRYCTEQDQENLNSIMVPFIHGNMPLEQVEKLAEFLENFGPDTMRFSRRQNVQLRNIPGKYLANVYNLLNNTGVDIHKPYLLSNLVSCTGADTCQLGICFSKGGIKAIHERLQNFDEADLPGDLDINISGCPNSCGQHLVADLGFAGRVSRNGRIYPSYTVFAGASAGADNATLPVQLGEVSAKDLPGFTEHILQAFGSQGKEQTFKDFIMNNRELIDNILLQYKTIPSFEEDESYYIDWGNNDLFSIEGRGGGECSVGILDSIEAEIKTIKNCSGALNGQQETEQHVALLSEMVFAAAKLLVLTLPDLEVKDQEVYDICFRHFMENPALDGEYRKMLENAVNGNFAALLRQKEEAMAFSEAAISYYKNLDDSLQAPVMIKDISVKQLQEMLRKKEDIALIDVREDWEKELADIGGKLIPLGTIEENIHTIPRDKKTILYCRSGRRSTEAVTKLINNHGFTNLYNLKGGILAWADEIDNNIEKY